MEMNTLQLRYLNKLINRDLFLHTYGSLNLDLSTLYVDLESDSYYVAKRSSDGFENNLDDMFDGDWYRADDLAIVTLAEKLNPDNESKNETLWEQMTKPKVNIGGITSDDLRNAFKPVPDIRIQVKGTMSKETAKQLGLEFIKESPGYIPSKFETDLNRLLGQFKMMLLAKNKVYGNSALEPVQIFSKSSSSEVILQQIDHKLSRLKNSDTPTKNDTIDLLGYLTLYCLDQGWTDLTDIY